uniref:NADH-ubiquinone oxidoreductase chain 6 n=1 Tax=Rhinoestrus usbekistanicus TaxID=204923 RepID=A0A6C0PSS8_9MUSC|nr:NADH dehydrogenase subunit 6 [Rhinoestrus usbekistanicus]QHX99787.1 NADH dehydrogenase subunit 6 [Rhinoestrus usbekistanicus]
MIQWLLMSLLLLFNFIFMTMNHPLAMGLTLLIQTTLISLMTGMFMKTYWFSYMLFLVFLGGMLVLFIYVTSLASNEMFSFSTKLMLFSLSILIPLMLMMLLMDKNNFHQIINNEMNSIYQMISYISENSLLLNKLYNYPTNMLTMNLMIYLLITLIAVVKITKLSKGPLRPMFN